ncbi:MAG: hypothetical protein RMK18_08670 [Armatimonadota bacterium]|nr:hypothetical protein [Armatimonadota bacterium]MCX7777802.1 hypothetical protein [Armatimonadota bacterium]MDW8025916.1 hypothetical protein [Armatimonadota bacterium]
MSERYNLVRIFAAAIKGGVRALHVQQCEGTIWVVHLTPSVEVIMNAFG